MFCAGSLSSQVHSNFFKVNGNFGHTKDKWKGSKSILEHNLHEHHTKLRLIVSKLNRLMYELSLFGVSLTKCIYKSTLRKENHLQIKTKLKKIRYHMPSTKAFTSYVPVINLSSFELNSELVNFGLKHYFVNKSKHTKRNVAVELESLASEIDHNIDSSEKENIHKYLRSWTNKFTENIHGTKDNTFKSLRKLKQHDDVVLLNADKESCIIILSKIDYVDIVNEMMQDGITKGVYEVTTDNIHKDLASFQNFLHRHFKCHPDYDKMRPSSNQPARFIGLLRCINLIILKISI